MPQADGVLQHAKTVGHAVSILVDRARAGPQPVNTRSAARRLGISQSLMFQIVSLLSKAGLLKTSRGWLGGLCLARAADTITVADVVRAIDRRSAVAMVDVDREPIFCEARTAFFAVLERHTIASLAAQPSGAVADASEHRRRASLGRAHPF